SQNLRYLTGFTGSAGWLLVTRTEQLVGTDSRYWEQCAKQAPEFALVRYKGQADQTDVLKDAIAARRLQRIGIESEHLTVAKHAEWTNALGVALVSTSGIVETLRASKDAREVEVLRRALAITDAAYEHILHWIETGMTEKEVAWELEAYMRTHGADGMAFDVHVASGPNAAEPHHPPTERAIAQGDPIWIDMGARLDGFNADLTRSFVLGEPDEQFTRVYEVVLRANQAAAHALRAGVSGRELHEIAHRVIRDAGYGEYFGHGLGHGLGLAVHEKPSAGAQSQDTIPAGAILTIEPGIYIPGWGGVRIEDVALVNEDGAEILTRASKWQPPSAAHTQPR
ncbi:MAG: aminopeptidase P family protein, partial [Chloroflexi bacterium]|nr:aminopeptidase P family protein [Chloroflexota bacterium]